MPKVEGMARTIVATPTVVVATMAVVLPKHQGHCRRCLDCCTMLYVSPEDRDTRVCRPQWLSPRAGRNALFGTTENDYR